MEEGIALAKFPGMGEKGGDEDSEDEDSECEATRAMVAKQNRKGKKSGGFQSMGFSHAVYTGIMRKGYRVPTPIQRKCIPLVMDGKDVVAMARTGSGKTAAFLLPMFERLKAHSTKVGARGIVLSPTRELATQTFKFTKELGRFTSLKAVLVLGGDHMEDQFSALHGNPDIIIATPGRFLHLLVEMDLTLSSVEYVVFDEADRLFEMGFAEQLQDIIRRLPECRQTLLFSATLPRMLVEFAKAGLKDPVLVRLDVDSKLSEQLKVFFFSVRREDKACALLHLLKSVVPSTEQTLVFTATKHHVEYLKELLEQAGVSCTYIYSSLDQTARKINVAKFVNKKVMTLLVTDVAARGIDIPTLDNVINYNFPAKPKLFVHRVGRVARAGRSGCAYSLVSSDEVAYMLDLHLFLGLPLQLGVKSSSGVYGGVPQHLLDQEDGLIKQLHSRCPDLDDLKRVSENAQKQYVRSRSQPAPESIKRTKKMSASVPLHPLFESLCSSVEMAQCELLSNLKQYKPSQTIFEIHSTTQTSAKEIMQSKRHYHSAVIETSRQQSKVCPTVPGGEELTLSSRDQEQVEDLVSSFQTERLANEQIRKKKKLRNKSSEHYIKYTPNDLHSEKGLSLADNFDKQASGAVLDLDGDDETMLRKSRTTMTWDRKRKKFVGDSGQDGPREKRIKTESGHWIRASYKSNAYKEWKEKHKIDAQWEEEEGGAGGVAPKSGPRRGYRHKKGAGERKEGGPVADLKPRAAILKKRQKKVLMERRNRLKKTKNQKPTGKNQKPSGKFRVASKRRK